MAKIGKEYIILILLFLLVLGLRLFLTLPEKGFEYEAYDSLRQAEHIKAAGTPLFNDPLSYSGRTIVFPPLFYYILAGFSFIMPLALAAKLIPSLGWAALVLIVYLIAKQLTKNKTASLFAAFFAGLVPIMYSTINQVSAISISLPLILLLSYSFLRIEEKGFATLCIILTIILLLTTTAALLMLMSFLAYILIVRLEKQDLSKKEVEVALFLFFIALWFNLLLYKKAFFIHDIKFIWQNIPAPLLSTYFQDISFLGIIYVVGVIPLLLGVYAIYHVFFRTKSRDASLYISLVIITFIALWLKLVPFNTGLVFLSIGLIILSAYSIKIILNSIAKTKTPRATNTLIAIILLLFLLTAFTPFLITANAEKKNIPPKQDIDALAWLKNNSDDGSVVLGRVEEGFIITYFADRKNIADSNFLLEKNIDQRYNDINHLFTLRLKSEAIRLINDYRIDYIYLSTESMKAYNTESLFYADNECFELAYDRGAKVYRFLGCTIA